MGDARAGHSIQPGLGGNAAAQLNRVKGKRAAGGINPAAVYAEANRDFSARALVATATICQGPSNWPAIAGAAEQMIANAVNRAKARIRKPIIGSSCRTARQFELSGDPTFTSEAGSRADAASPPAG